MVNILQDTISDISERATQYDSLALRYIKSAGSSWRNAEDLPVYYDVQYDSLPDNCVVYQRLGKTQKLLLFQKINSKEINTSLDNFILGINTNESSCYLLKNNQLLIATTLGKYECVFQIGEIPNERISSLGRTIFSKNYAQINFFDQTFYDIFEFFYQVEQGPDEYEFLLWFTSDIELIRIEGQGFGYILL
jgi:hypothetical protein